MDLHVANMAAFLGAALAMGLGAIGSGWGIGYAVVGAARGMARQPSENSRLFRSMLISQAIASNPSIFALVISVLLFLNGAGNLAAPDSWAQAAAFLAAGLSIGIGALGSGAGNGVVAAEALEAMARVPRSGGRVTVMMVVGQAMGQTPVLFSLVISILLVGDNAEFSKYALPDQIIHAGRLLGMGICMGAGALGPGLGSSFVGAKFCKGLAENPSVARQLNNTFFVGAGISQSTAIYAFVISLLLLTY